MAEEHSRPGAQVKGACLASMPDAHPISWIRASHNLSGAKLNEYEGRFSNRRLAMLNIVQRHRTQV